MVVLALAFAGLHLRDPGLAGEVVAASEPAAGIDAARLDAAAATAAVPANLTPALADARDDVPVVFTDGCNGDLGPTPRRWRPHRPAPTATRRASGPSC